MKVLKFEGDITLNEVFDMNRGQIYDSLITAISDALDDPNSQSAQVVKISINNDDYSIELTRNKFKSGIDNAILYYESLEEYEKCANCVSLLKRI